MSKRTWNDGLMEKQFALVRTTRIVALESKLQMSNDKCLMSKRIWNDGLMEKQFALVATSMIGI